MQYIFNAYGEKRSLEDIQMINHLLSLKEKYQTNYWPVIEECLRIWSKKKPQEYKSFLIELKDMQETRRGKFATSQSEMFRYTLDIPETVVYMLRKLYTPQEMPMDKKFFRSWAKKFPNMKVAQQI